MSKKSVKSAMAQGAKAPEDHKEKEVPFSQVRGHQLLVPLDQLPVEKAFELMSAFDGIDMESDSVNVKDLLPLVTIIREGGFVADQEGFAKFAVATNFESTIKLITAYIGEMSKGNG